MKKLLLGVAFSLFVSLAFSSVTTDQLAYERQPEPHAPLAYEWQPEPHALLAYEVHPEPHAPRRA